MPRSSNLVCSRNTRGTLLWTMSFIIVLISAEISYCRQTRYPGNILNLNTSIKWSTPQECMRPCRDGDPPRYCFYHFIVEFYSVMGPACDSCKPDIHNQQLAFEPECECIQADGLERAVLSINRMIPGPSIQVCLHDKVVIDVENLAEGLEVTMHWHGIRQNGYQYYDGVPYVTQCPIDSGTIFRYQFSADNSGTHMYHSHLSVHMIDGQHGAFVVRSPPSLDPHYSLYDEDLPEHVIVLSDWLHELSVNRFPGYFRHDPGQTAKNILINGKGNWKDFDTGEETGASLEKITVEAGKRYRFRVISALGTVCIGQLSIEDHPLLIIAVDGENIEPIEVDAVNLATGERVDFVLTTNRPVRSYWIRVKAHGECHYKEVQQYAILQYSGALETPPTEQLPYISRSGVKVLNSLNSMLCDYPLKVPEICINDLRGVGGIDPKFYQVVPDYRIILPFWFFTYNTTSDLLFGPESYKRYMESLDLRSMLSLVGNISFVDFPSPPISQDVGYELMCNPSNMPSHCTEPCTCTHVYHIAKNSLVEVIIYDAREEPMFYHPFHLHGYAYRVFRVGQYSDLPNLSMRDIKEVIADHEDQLRRGEYHVPPAKDTLVVPKAGYAIVRFLADNPGWWLYHCHFLWHTVTGMNVIMHVGEKSDLPPVPENFPQCSSWTPMPKF